MDALKEPVLFSLGLLKFGDRDGHYSIYPSL